MLSIARFLSIFHNLRIDTTRSFRQFAAPADLTLGGGTNIWGGPPLPDRLLTVAAAQKGGSSEID